MSAHSFVKIGIAFAFMVCSAARPATAEVIKIVRGSFTYIHGASADLNISGTGAFELQASALTGLFNAIDQCSFPECQPGTVVEIGARWIGNDLPGTAMLRGTVYGDVGGLNSPNSADVRFAGQVTMPPVSDEPTSITVPFDFAGRFVYSESLSQPQQDALLTGGGFVTLSLERFPGENSWRITGATFEFRPAKH